LLYVNFNPLKKGGGQGKRQKRKKEGSCGREKDKESLWKKPLLKKGEVSSLKNQKLESAKRRGGYSNARSFGYDGLDRKKGQGPAREDLGFKETSPLPTWCRAWGRKGRKQTKGGYGTREA